MELFGGNDSASAEPAVQWRHQGVAGGTTAPLIEKKEN